MKGYKRGQSVSEYFIVMTVILAALLATGFIDNVREVFRTYFTKATTAITAEK